MGWKLKRVDLGKLCPNEEKDIVLTLRPENRAAIHGVVKFPNGKPVEGAVVKLFKKSKDKCKLTPITFSFTDKCGQFLFGVPSEVDFVIKVFFYTPERKMDHDKDKDKEVDWDDFCLQE